MLLIRNLLFLSFLLPSIGMAHNTASVKGLLLRHIEAIGGEMALMQMQSISRSGQITFYEEDNLKGSYCYHTDIVYPKKLSEQIKGKQIEYDRGTDGQSFWLWTGAQYEFTQDKELQAYMRDTAEQANRDMLWVKKESDNFEVIPTPPYWAPSNSQCIKAVKSSNSTKHTYCFDSSTGLLNSLGSAEEYRIESDWREVGNIKIPFHFTHYQHDVKRYEIQLDYAKLNQFIPDVQFTKPESPQFSCE